MGPAEPVTPVGPRPREVPDARGWGCPGAPQLPCSRLGQALAPGRALTEPWAPGAASPGRVPSAGLREDQ